MIPAASCQAHASTSARPCSLTSIALRRLSLLRPPLALYVGYHSFFFTSQSDAFTQLGATLRFYGISLRFAPTPQAKGKIERARDFWQKRLPPLFAAEHIATLPEANALLQELRLHHNRQQ